MTLRCEDCEGPAPTDLEAPTCPLHGTMVADDEMGRSWHCAVCAQPKSPARAIPLGFSRFQVPADYSKRRTGSE